jgi:hypothetical protein
VTRRRHPDKPAAAVALGIIGFDLAEGAGRSFAAEHEDPTIEHARRSRSAVTMSRKAGDGVAIYRLIPRAA